MRRSTVLLLPLLALVAVSTAWAVLGAGRGRVPSHPRDAGAEGAGASPVRFVPDRLPVTWGNRVAWAMPDHHARHALTVMVTSGAGRPELTGRSQATGSPMVASSAAARPAGGTTARRQGVVRSGGRLAGTTSLPAIVAPSGPDASVCLIHPDESARTSTISARAVGLGRERTMASGEPPDADDADEAPDAPDAPDALITVGALVLDPTGRRAWWEGAALGVTDAELRLLEALARRPGRWVATRTLAIAVWGSDDPSAVTYVHLYVRYLRQRLGEISDRPAAIRRHSGRGYSLRV